MANLSLTHYLIRCEREHGLDPTFGCCSRPSPAPCKTIGHAVGLGALGGVLGGAGTTNIQGEAQKKLDVLSNEILVEANSWAGTSRAWRRKKWTIPSGFQWRTRAENTYCCSIRSTGPATSTSTCRSAPSFRCCACRPESRSRTNPHSCSRELARSAPAMRYTARRPSSCCPSAMACRCSRWRVTRVRFC